MRDFAQWFYPVHLTVDFDAGEEPDDKAVLTGLSPYRHVHTEDFTQYEFANRMDPVFELWRRSGYWDMAHPLDGEHPPLGDRPRVHRGGPRPDAAPGLGPGGHILLWPAYTRTSDAPLFMHPEVSS